MLYYDVVCKKSLTVYMFDYQINIYTYTHVYIYESISMDIINVLL